MLHFATITKSTYCRMSTAEWRRQGNNNNTVNDYSYNNNSINNFWCHLFLEVSLFLNAFKNKHHTHTYYHSFATHIHRHGNKNNHITSIAMIIQLPTITTKATEQYHHHHHQEQFRTRVSFGSIALPTYFKNFTITTPKSFNSMGNGERECLYFKHTQTHTH